MYGLLALCLCTFYTVTKFCILPVYRYYADRKGLRAYPNMSLFSGISDVPFALEARRGFRSKRLADLHKTYPVVRIGPNSLSYGDARAVKVYMSSSVGRTSAWLTASRTSMGTERSASKTISTLYSQARIRISPT